MRRKGGLVGSVRRRACLGGETLDRSLALLQECNCGVKDGGGLKMGIYSHDGTLCGFIKVLWVPL